MGTVMQRHNSSEGLSEAEEKNLEVLNESPLWDQETLEAPNMNLLRDWETLAAPNVSLSRDWEMLEAPNENLPKDQELLLKDYSQMFGSIIHGYRRIRGSVRSFD